MTATIEEAEAAWLAAITGAAEGQRRLMLPDCVVVHGPVGFVHDRETFLRHSAGMAPIVAADAGEVTVREHLGMGIVTCHQKMYFAFVPDLPPFLVQAAVTRIWFEAGGEWLLGHMQLSRRQPPG